MDRRMVNGWLVALAVAGLGAGCAHSKKNQQTTTNDSTAAAPAAAPAPAPAPVRAPDEPVQIGAKAQDETAGLNEADLQAHKDLETALAALKDANVFFDFDSATLSEEGQKRLAPIGEILGKHPGFKIRIEGNCDERGTADYNLVLGQKRADAAKTYLLRMGAAEGQIATVSYGAERPKATGKDEASYQENRRDDIVVTDSPAAKTPAAK